MAIVTNWSDCIRIGKKLRIHPQHIAEAHGILSPEALLMKQSTFSELLRIYDNAPMWSLLKRTALMQLGEQMRNSKEIEEVEKRVCKPVPILRLVHTIFERNIPPENLETILSKEHSSAHMRYVYNHARGEKNSKIRWDALCRMVQLVKE